MQMDTITTLPVCEAPALVEVPVMGQTHMVTLWMEVKKVTTKVYRVTCIETGDSILLHAMDDITYLRPSTVAEETETYLALHNMGLID